MTNISINFMTIYRSIFASSIVVIYAFSNFTYLSILFQLMFIFLTLLVVLRNRKLTLTIHFYWMLTFIFWSLIVSIGSVNQWNSLSDIINLSIKFLFYTSIISYINTPEKFINTLKIISAAGFILVIRLMLFTPVSFWGTERLGETIGLNPNAIGISLSISSITTLYLISKLNKPILYTLLIPLISVGLFTGSKKAFIAIMMGLSLLMLLSAKGYVKKMKMIFISAVFIFCVYLMIFNIPQLYEVIGIRIENALLYANNAGIDKSTLTRQSMIEEGLRLFQENPITGYGLNNFNVITFYNGYSHNNVIELLTGVGLVGTIIYYILPLSLLILSSLKIKEKEYSIIIVLLIITLFLDIANVSYRQLMTQVIISICVSKYIINKNLLIDKFDKRRIKHEIY